MRNRIINGDFRVSQYNGTTSFTPSSGNYSIDRFLTIASASSKFTGQQLSSSPPTGFSYYLGLTSSSAYSVPAGEIFAQIQRVEGLNVADLNWGSTNAKPVTLSFQVQSSLTGTFGGAIRSGDGNYAYPFTYTISSANTWTTISITISGPTTGGTTAYPINNSTGLAVSFGIGVGSTYSATAGSWQSGNYYSATGAVSVVGTSSATFYITGVQLEAGTTASPFEYRQFTTELQLCQRYYQLVGVGGSYYNATSGQLYRSTSSPVVQPRAAPTVTSVSAFLIGNVSSTSWGISTYSTTPSMQAVNQYTSSSGGSGVYTDANYIVSLSSEL
jgi:hypothetical protein